MVGRIKTLRNDVFDFRATKFCQSDTSTSLSARRVEALRLPQGDSTRLRMTMILLQSLFAVKGSREPLQAPSSCYPSSASFHSHLILSPDFHPGNPLFRHIFLIQLEGSVNVGKIFSTKSKPTLYPYPIPIHGCYDKQEK